MITIDDLIARSHDILDLPSQRDSFHRLLDDNMSQFFSHNVEKLGNIELKMFKSLDSISRIIDIDDRTYVTYNKLNGDIILYIHSLALGRFCHRDYLISALLNAIWCMLGGTYSRTLETSSQLIPQAASVTELFILYHEIGHIEYSKRRSQTCNQELITYTSKICEVIKEAENALSPLNPTSDTRKNMSLSALKTESLMYVMNNSEAGRINDIFSTENIGQLEEESFCDIYSSNIVRHAYPTLDEETNLMLCGVSLWAYGIATTMFNLLEIIKTGERVEEYSNVTTMFKMRASILKTHLEVEKKHQQYFEKIKLYIEIDKALTEVWEYLIEYAGDPVGAKEKINLYLKNL